MYIFDATIARKTDVVGVLLKAGTSLGPDRGGAAIMVAVRRGDLKLVEMLLKAGGDAKFRDEHGNSLILSAIQPVEDRDAILEALIAAGADVNVANDRGEVPLHICHLALPRSKTAEILASHGALDPNPGNIAKERAEIQRRQQ